jgi:hypothetical protein
MREPEVVVVVWWWLVVGWSSSCGGVVVIVMVVGVKGRVWGGCWGVGWLLWWLDMREQVIAVIMWWRLGSCCCRHGFLFTDICFTGVNIELYVIG